MSNRSEDEAAAWEGPIMAGNCCKCLAPIFFGTDAGCREEEIECPACAARDL